MDKTMNLTRNSIAAFLLLSTVSTGVLGQLKCYQSTWCDGGTLVTGCTRKAGSFEQGDITVCCPAGASFENYEPNLTCPWPDKSNSTLEVDDGADSNWAWSGGLCCWESPWCDYGDSGSASFSCNAQWRPGKVPICCPTSDRCLYDPTVSCNFDSDSNLEATASAAPVDIAMTGVAAMAATVAFVAL